MEMKKLWSVWRMVFVPHNCNYRQTLFCIGSRFISLGQCRSIQLTPLFKSNLSPPSSTPPTAVNQSRRSWGELPCFSPTQEGIAPSGSAVSYQGRCTAQRELLTAITNCRCGRVGERHKLVCVYSLTDPLIPATPPVSLLCPNLSGGLTGPGWQMGRRGQSSVGSVERLRSGASVSPLSSALDHLWHGLH